MTSSTTGHEHCLRPGCARRLTCAASRARGYGWGCWRRIRTVMRAGEATAKAGELAGYTVRQAAQARELIEDAALIPAPVEGECLAVSSDGTEVYPMTEEACPCPSSGGCYHRLAMAMVLAA